MWKLLLTSKHSHHHKGSLSHAESQCHIGLSSFKDWHSQCLFLWSPTPGAWEFFKPPKKEIHSACRADLGLTTSLYKRQRARAWYREWTLSVDSSKIRHRVFEPVRTSSSNEHNRSRRHPEACSDLSGHFLSVYDFKLRAFQLQIKLYLPDCFFSCLYIPAVKDIRHIFTKKDFFIYLP